MGRNTPLHKDIKGFSLCFWNINTGLRQGGFYSPFAPFHTKKHALPKSAHSHGTAYPLTNTYPPTQIAQQLSVFHRSPSGQSLEVFSGKRALLSQGVAVEQARKHFCSPETKFLVHCTRGV